MTLPRLFRALMAALALTLIVAACGDDDDAAESVGDAVGDAGDGVQVTDVWARSTAPTADTGAVYLTLTSDVDRALVSVSVPADIAEAAQVHETVAADDMDEVGDMGDMEDHDDMEHDDADHDGTDHDDMEHGDGGMTMQSVQSLALPAGESVRFAPGGYHVMLLGLVNPLEEGQMFTITLTFDDDTTEEVEVAVVDAAP